MSLVVPLTSINFIQYKHDDFIRRLHKSNNKRALDFVSQHDMLSNGILCSDCNEILPSYHYKQSKTCKNGIDITKCTKCINNARCPYEVLIGNTKSRSKSRDHDEPELTVPIVKQMFILQKGRCRVKNEKMKEKHGGGDPLNMSIERINNTIGYTIANTILICQKYQIGQGYDFDIEEIKLWFKYDSTTDGFVYNKSIFNKHDTVQRKKRKVIHDGNNKSCTDCDKMLPLSSFSHKMSFCKTCNCIRKKIHCNTPYGFMIKVTINAKHNATRRGIKRHHSDTSDECDDDLFTLFTGIISKQKGRCYRTGIAFVYELNHKFAPSPDRLYNDKGYVVGNVRMIISPLNTPNNK